MLCYELIDAWTWDLSLMVRALLGELACTDCHSDKTRVCAWVLSAMI